MFVDCVGLAFVDFIIVKGEGKKDKQIQVMSKSGGDNIWLFIHIVMLLLGTVLKQQPSS